MKRRDLLGEGRCKRERENGEEEETRRGILRERETEYQCHRGREEERENGSV